MSEIKVNKISPATGTAITLGDSGDTLTVPSGGTIVNSGTATGFGGGGAWTFIKSLTESGASTVELINGTSDVVFDNTYIAYELLVFNWRSSTDDSQPWIRIRTASDTTWQTSGYESTGVSVASDSASGQGWTDAMYEFDATGTNTGEKINLRMTFYNPAQTSDYPSATFVSTGIRHTGDRTFKTGQSVYGTAGAIDGIQLGSSGTNISFDFLKLYGLSGS